MASSKSRPFLGMIRSLISGRVWVRHKKTGGQYEAFGSGRIQTEVPLNDMDRVVIYRGTDGEWWVRRAEEFNVDRFEFG